MTDKAQGTASHRIDIPAAMQHPTTMWIGTVDLHRKRSRTDADAFSLPARVPDPHAWPAGAVVGARVLMDSLWSDPVIGMVSDVRQRQGRTVYSVRVPGHARPIPYDEQGRFFPNARMDFLDPVRVLAEGEAADVPAPEVPETRAFAASRPARRWPAGAAVGRAVLLVNGWGLQKVGVIQAVGEVNGTWQCLLHLPGEGRAAYTRSGSPVLGRRVDGFAPAQVLSRAAQGLWMLRTWGRKVRTRAPR